ncbi:MAG: C39 family peptidase [Anaerolineaceae bacterium]|nr:C39 family peptidase [Anaerolineaceae bacterium]
MRWIPWLIVAGLLGDALLFLWVSGALNATSVFAVSSNTSTPVQLANIQLTLSTPTPFQPLPTETPTLTPTPTNTPTPTQTNTPEPTATPKPTKTPRPEPTSDGLPASYAISGVYGYDQAHRLSCESRSAVDWARFFGVEIGEDTFQYALPSSDDPDSGFVGSPDGMEGFLPPNSYGVHAGPVADLLQQYELNAQAVHGMSFEDFKQEIASGQPVIVWVFGNTWWGGTSVQYTASNDHTSTVIAYEHTVIVTAYDETEVTILDGGTYYYRTIAQFESSWATLGNMAVIMQ